MSDMTFDNINKDTDCRIPKDIKVDTDNYFLRRIPKKTLRNEAKDFQSE